MKAKVTEQGVIIPKTFLEGVEEVDIRKENGTIVVVPTSKHDPILDLGKHPVRCGAPDASEHHDKYLYGSTS
ncbi:MAG: hypothetical protein HY694_08255 [Deltaproteobacteria bacterium]|nr:hypothetical protein [Deltaproteobacteria bacterium]